MFLCVQQQFRYLSLTGRLFLQEKKEKKGSKSTRATQYLASQISLITIIVDHLINKPCLTCMGCVKEYNSY